MPLVELALKSLRRAVAHPAMKKSKKSEIVIRVLHELKLRPEHPNPDFSTVYVHALVHYAAQSKPAPLLDFLRNEDLRSAVRTAWKTNNYSYFIEEATIGLQLSRAGTEVKNAGIDLEAELLAFIGTFRNVVEATRHPKEVETHRLIVQIQQGVQDLSDRIYRLTTVEEKRRLVAREQDAIDVQGVIHRALFSTHTRLFGRDRDVEEIGQLLIPEAPGGGVILGAFGGMGKTALAKEVCLHHKLWRKYDAVLGATAKQRSLVLARHSSHPPSLRNVAARRKAAINERALVSAFARQLGLDNTDALTDQHLRQAIREGLNGRTALLIVDNLESLHDTQSVIELIASLCQPSAQKVLITTREIPEDPGDDLAVREVREIRDSEACRKLVLERLRQDQPDHMPSERAIDAILEIADGHPLALEVLGGKLLTQGETSIFDLAELPRASSIGKSDAWMSQLFTHVFDDRFEKQVGAAGIDLLQIIADEEAGLTEGEARTISGLDPPVFERTISELFRMYCIRRTFGRSLSLLTMHSVARSHFRTS